jgi:hypothetical protein
MRSRRLLLREPAYMDPDLRFSNRPKFGSGVRDYTEFIYKCIKYVYGVVSMGSPSETFCGVQYWIHFQYIRKVNK